MEKRTFRGRMSNLSKVQKFGQCNVLLKEFGEGVVRREL